MEVMWSADMWGTPVGLGMFFFLMGGGTGLFCWGLSKVTGRK